MLRGAKTQGARFDGARRRARGPLRARARAAPARGGRRLSRRARVRGSVGGARPRLAGAAQPGARRPADSRRRCSPPGRGRIARASRRCRSRCARISRSSLSARASRLATDLDRPRPCGPRRFQDQLPDRSGRPRRRAGPCPDAMMPVLAGRESPGEGLMKSALSARRKPRPRSGRAAARSPRAPARAAGGARRRFLGAPAGRLDRARGKIADRFNDIVVANQEMARELERVGQVVGKEGKTRQRMRFARPRGAWGEMEVSFNTLIDDLLRPTTEVTRAIAAVAQGNLPADRAARRRWSPARRRVPALRHDRQHDDQAARRLHRPR